MAMAGPAMFAAMRIPILAGREFDGRDAPGRRRWPILNQKLAEALWPGRDPIGRQLVVWEGKPAVTVVGLTKTVKTFPVGPPFFMIYVPLRAA
jgi:hypothetical protein